MLLPLEMHKSARRQFSWPVEARRNGQLSFWFGRWFLALLRRSEPFLSKAAAETRHVHLEDAGVMDEAIDRGEFSAWSRRT